MKAGCDETEWQRKVGGVTVNGPAHLLTHSFIPDTFTS